MMMMAKMAMVLKMTIMAVISKMLLMAHWANQVVATSPHKTEFTDTTSTILLFGSMEVSIKVAFL